MIDRTFPPHPARPAPSVLARAWLDEPRSAEPLERALWLRAADGDTVCVPARMLGDVREIVVKAEKEIRRRE